MDLSGVPPDFELLRRRLLSVYAAVQRHDASETRRLLAELAPTSEHKLSQDVARIAGGLQSALRQLQLDTRLSRLAGHELPDASARLGHVLKLTEDAAHRTLDLAEQSRDLAGNILAAAENVAPDFRALAAREATRLREQLNEIVQSQSFQDLSGQIIRRVITLVASLEAALRELLSAAGQAPDAPDTEAGAGLAGPAVPGTADRPASQTDADDLLSELGI